MSEEVTARLSQFLFHEADLLDRRDWDGWGALFAADGVYWMPASPSQADPFDHVSLVYDTPLLREIRLRRLKEQDAASLESGVETSHHVSNVMIAAADSESGRFDIASRLIVAQYTPGKTATFHGRCRHELRLDALTGAISILAKRVDLLGAGGPLGDILTIL